MTNASDPAPAPGPVQPNAEIDAIVAQVAAEAQTSTAKLSDEQREYLREHALRKPLGVRHIWALGVGAVITGEYFGWNGGLLEGGPIGMLLATLFVCVLYMLWVLTLSELAVAMPFAGGPLAYGRRASGPTLGFVMGWSMFLETLFATIGTATATGGAVTFLVRLAWPGLFVDYPDSEPILTTAFGLATVAAFAALQSTGARSQARVMNWMTYGAIVGLIWFWIACIPAIDLNRLVRQPFGEAGPWGALKAIPYAIWWLVIIEAVALAAEEAHEPHRTIPRGLVLAQATLIGLVLLTWFIVTTAAPDIGIVSKVSYPLQETYREAWPAAGHRWHLILFSVVALCGMVASYNGMIYAVSRQSFSLGRAGYLPRILGHVHARRRTPDVSIHFWSLVVAGFVLWYLKDQAAVNYAVLTCNLTALVWYVLATICLFVLRRREPQAPRLYSVPGYPYTPALVVIMSLLAAGVYGWLNEPIVLYWTGAMYVLGLAYYLVYGRNRLEPAAPEELAARAATESADRRSD